MLRQNETSVHIHGTETFWDEHIPLRHTDADKVDILQYATHSALFVFAAGWLDGHGQDSGRVRHTFTGIVHEKDEPFLRCLAARLGAHISILPSDTNRNQSEINWNWIGYGDSWQRKIVEVHATKPDFMYHCGGAALVTASGVICSGTDE